MISAIRKTGFVISADLAGKLGELQATADCAAWRLREDAPHLAAVLREWHGILRNLRTSTYFEQVTAPEQIEEVEEVA